jgi:trk system potassium uptake protein TrkA
MAKKLIGVIGLGQFGSSIVTELVKNGNDVLAIDHNEEAVSEIAKLIPTVFIADSTNEKALIELGMKDVDVCIIAFGSNLEASILTTVLVKELGVPRIIVRVDKDYYIPILKKLGATEVITPQKAAGIGLANRLRNDDYRDFYKLDNKYSIVSIEINSEFEPVTVMDLNPKNHFGVNLVLINRNGNSFVPGGSDSLLPKDWVFVVGTTKDIKSFGDYLDGKGKKKKK